MSEPEDDDEPPKALQPTVNAADPDAIKRRKNEQSLQAREDLTFWQMALTTKVGRRCLWSLIAYCSPFQLMVAASPTGVPDQFGTFYKQGQQHYSLWIWLKLLQLDRENALLMQDENDPFFQSLRPTPEPVRRRKTPTNKGA